MKMFRDIWKFIHFPFHEVKLLMKGLSYSFLLIIGLKILPVKTWLFINSKFLQPDIDPKLNASIVEKNFNSLVHRFPWNCTCLFKAHLMQFLLIRAGIKSDIQIAVTKIQSGTFNAHAYVVTEAHKTYFKNSVFTDLCTL